MLEPVSVLASKVPWMSYPHYRIRTLGGGRWILELTDVSITETRVIHLNVVYKLATLKIVLQLYATFGWVWISLIQVALADYIEGCYLFLTFKQFSCEVTCDILDFRGATKTMIFPFNRCKLLVNCFPIVFKMFSGLKLRWFFWGYQHQSSKEFTQLISKVHKRFHI